METKTKTKAKLATGKPVKANEVMPKIKKRGFVGMWKGKIKINGDIDNVFSLRIPTPSTDY